MNDLLEFAVDAHGGLDRWNDFHSLRAELSIDGGIWHVKQQPGMLLRKTPFLYTTPGFEVEEIEPWHEDGELWRSLKVTFPERVASHTRQQITRFGPDGLVRRHDYTVDILGGATGAKYTSGYREFQGIRLPTAHRVFAYDDAMRKVPEPLLVSIDVADVRFR